VPQYFDVVRQFQDTLLRPQVVLRDFPLDRSCNSSIPASRSVHRTACTAAAAARLVRVSASSEVAGRFEAWLYANGPTLTRETVIERLRELSLADQFPTREPEMLMAIERDITRGRELGLAATPALAIRGRLAPFHSADDLRRVLGAELKELTPRAGGN
jgi:hypothetical protein